MDITWEVISNILRLQQSLIDLGSEGSQELKHRLEKVVC